MDSDNAASPPSQDAQKRAAAERAATCVQSGMVVGLGTGSTATHVIAALIRRARTEALRIVCVPTSERSAEQARQGGLTLTDFAAHQALDLTIDGADQVASGTLALIKGMGGALLREKIVAAASRRLVIVIDATKLAPRLALPVPVEIVQFGWQATFARIRSLGVTPTLRLTPAGIPFLTDGGNLILDCACGPLDRPAATDAALRNIVGVIETGLFLDRADEVLVADATGVRSLTPATAR